VACYDVALVILVDRAGAVLLQHRDAHTSASPNQWSLPGGHVEPEETPRQAARRELLEETGIAIEELHPWWSGPRPFEPGFRHVVTVHVFHATTDASQNDVVMGEGQAMEFVRPEAVLDRDLAVTSAFVLPGYLATPPVGSPQSVVASKGSAVLRISREWPI
jgi:8-oxo-dGTP pyrophosphatase MutT (NUDIX family)